MLSAPNPQEPRGAWGSGLRGGKTRRGAGGLGHTVPLLRPAKEIPRGKTPEQNPATWLEARNSVPEGKGGPRCPPPPPPAESRAWGGAHGRNPACPCGGRGWHLPGPGGKSTHGTAGHGRGWRAKSCRFVCAGPGRCKGILGGGEQRLLQGPMAAAPALPLPAGLGWGLIAVGSSDADSAPRRLHAGTPALRETLPAPTSVGLLWRSARGTWAGARRRWEPTAWVGAHGVGGSPGQRRGRAAAAALPLCSRLPAAPWLRCRESQEGPKDPQSRGQLVVLTLLLEIRPAEAAGIRPLRQKRHGCRWQQYRAYDRPG